MNRIYSNTYIYIYIYRSTAFSSGALSTRRTWNCWSGSKGGLQKWSKGWSTSPM